MGVKFDTNWKDEILIEKGWPVTGAHTQLQGIPHTISPITCLTKNSFTRTYVIIVYVNAV